MGSERVALLYLVLIAMQQVATATIRQSREIIITDAVGVPKGDSEWSEKGDSLAQVVRHRNS